MVIEEFQRLLCQKGEELYRDMPWRDDTRPYYVLVSELMLQQTQVSRVLPKFEDFIARFPNEEALASTELTEVLKKWQGLGYNRRAKFLHDSARMITNEFEGKFPDTEKNLVQLPGVGRNTAGAILAYAFNQPSIFIETNIRTVYIHHFFADRVDVTDLEIIETLKRTLDRNNPRQFYQNLMDYGTWLKLNGVRNISSSKHYKKQTPLRGSHREMRGMILRNITNGVTLNKLKSDERFVTAFEDLHKEGLIQSDDSKRELTK